MKRWFKLVLPVILLAVCLLLSGCKEMLQDADAQMREIVQALNSGSKEAVLRMCDPELAEKESFDAAITGLLAEWQTVDPDEMRLANLQVNTVNGETVTQASWYLPVDSTNNMLQYSLKQTKAGEAKLIMIGISPLPAGVDPEMLLGVDDEGTPDIGGLIRQSAPSMIWSLLCFVFLIVTIVDMIRKKPKGYGWFIAIAILVSVPIPVGNARYTLPVGSILYWCLRKVLLKKKRQLAAETAEELAAEQAARMARLAAMREAAETTEDPAEDALPVDPPEEP